MKIIVDTNILISGLIKDSVNRSILMNPKFQFYIPDFSLIEIFKYLPLIAKKTNLKQSKITKTLNIFLKNFKIIPISEYKPFLKKAFQIIGNIDEKDVPFIAIALAIKNDGILSNDRHFEKQDNIKVFSSEDLMQYF